MAANDEGLRPLVRLLHAAEEALTLVLFIGVHKLVDLAAEYAFHDFARALQLLRVAFFCAFSLVYVHQSFGMVTALVPGVRTFMEGVGRWAGRHLDGLVREYASRKRRAK